MKEKLDLPLKNVILSEENIKGNELDEIIKETGYEEVFTVKELDLSSEETKQAGNLIDLGRSIRFFIAERPDGLKAKAVIFKGEKDFNAHIFSPVGYEGHMFNHDYSQSELKGALRVAKDYNEKGNPIVKKEDK